MDDYPSTSDFKETLIEFLGLEKSQKILREEKQFIVHTNKKQRLGDVGRLVLYGLNDTRRLKGEALSKERETKSTAFVVRSNASNEELVSDLVEARRNDETFDDKRDLKVKSVNETDDRFEFDLSFTQKRIGRRTLVGEIDRETTVRVENTDDEAVRTAIQDYQVIDHANAVASFFETWEANRRRNGDAPVKKLDFSIRRLPLKDRIELFDDILSEEPGYWRLEDVQQMGVERGEQPQMKEIFEEVETEEDVQDVVDDNLKGIQDAVLRGEGLRSNPIIQTCEDNGYYFKSAKLFMDNYDLAYKLEVLIEFKQGPRQRFDVRIEQVHEEREDGLVEVDVSPDTKQQFRDTFRNMVTDLYYEKLRESSEDIEDVELNFTDLPGIAEGVEELLKENSYHSFEDISGSTLEELESIDGIGQMTAKKLIQAAED